MPPRPAARGSPGPGLPRSTGLGPVIVPPFFRPHAGGVGDGAGPFDQPLAAQLVQDGPVESRPEPGFCPLGEAAVRGLERDPNEDGRSRQAHPLVSTYTITVNTWRSGSGAVPPPWGRGRNFGRCGWTRSRRSSGTSRNDN
jgi:hypothetical protein